MSSDRILIVKDELQNRLVQLVHELFGSFADDKHHRSGKWFVRNPNRNDRKPGSFVIWTQGPAIGAWRDFATYDKGDILDLVCFVKRCDRKEGLKWAEDWLGIRSMSPAERRKAAEAAREAELARQIDAEREAAENRIKARKLFFSSQEGIAGTLAETYLATRGIDLSKTDYLAHTFRFKPDMEWWRGAEHDAKGNKIKPGPIYPAMVSAMADAKGKISACHVTFLAPDGSGKAPVEKPKLMWPATQGTVIRVSRGLKDERCTLALTEGIEDALSVTMARPDMRVWSAGSLGNLLHVPDHEKVRAFLVFRDNDWDKPEAVKLFDRVIERLQGFGKPVVALASPAGKDINDLLNEDEDE